MRKANTFSKNLSYWKKLESLELQTVSPDSTLQYFGKNRDHKNSHTHLNKVEVVTWQDIPEELTGDLMNSGAPN